MQFLHVIHVHRLKQTLSVLPLGSKTRISIHTEEERVSSRNT